MSLDDYVDGLLELVKNFHEDFKGDNIRPHEAVSDMNEVIRLAGAIKQEALSA
jgi:hypothetical protein